ncbi:uncharacterized protein J7T54_005202 [Emericellopsis cladophorae]|uniref:Uncharacterized protein n=1 Tax=Emericellopsis cladophorae TaxID=2686198 RepID=A0A9P9XXI9_9HYPO|nr:uncharacterized protein J7T54_005202 [Emericellopsis cladophorae]KAI6779388.1 hypothetical protein J7T54_005202 [Emericellopsis cladophorae]
MKTITTLWALGGAAATVAAHAQDVAQILLPAQWKPSDELGVSVVHVGASATTFALGCPTKASDCSVVIPTITQGAMTWGYGGEWQNIQGVDEYTLRNDCDIARGTMICTTAVTQVKDDVTRSGHLTGTTTYLGDLIHPIPITAGAKKPGEHTQATTTTSTPIETSASWTSTPVETSASSTTLATSTAMTLTGGLLPTSDAGHDDGHDDDATPTATPSVIPTDTPGAAVSVHRRSPRQLYKLLLYHFAGWLITAAIVGSFYGVLVHYSDKGVMLYKDRRVFNAVIIALSITLSLNLESCLKAMTGDLRWWVLSLRDWTLPEADLILQSEHFSYLLKLFVVASHWILRIVIVSWILLHIAAQVAVATIGLTHTVEAAAHATITRPGLVSVPDMSQIETTRVIKSPTLALAALRFTANSYGQIALGYNWGRLEERPEPGTLLSPGGNLQYCGSDRCEFVFYEANASQGQNYLTVVTNRSVASVAHCEAYRVIRGGDGNSTTITIDDADASELKVPTINGDDQTTFLTATGAGFNNSTGIVFAFEASRTNPWFYACNITVEPVRNAVLPEHELGANVSSLAAVAIALQAYGASTQGSSAAGTGAARQFQSYPAASSYGEPKGGNASAMALNMASFATGVIAVTALANDNVEIPGQRPLRGVEFRISDWTALHIILGLIAGVHFLLGLVTSLVADRVVVQTRSELTMAELLRPVGQKLEYRHVQARNRPQPTIRYRMGDWDEAYGFHTDCALEVVDW